MDTKEFYDACRDEGIDFGRRSGAEPGDCVDVAIHLLLKDKGWWEIWADGIVIAMSEGDLGERMAESLHVIRNNLDTIHNDRRAKDASTLIYTKSTDYHCASIGAHIFTAVMAEVASYVEKNIDQWFDDAASYHYEMEQCAKEDYYEGLREERMLNREN